MAGYNTEFGGMRFGSFLLAEYIEVISDLGRGHRLLPRRLARARARGPGPAVGGAQDLRLLIFLFIWIRATLPRLRYDQLMSFGWKVLLPLATLNVLVTAILLVVT